MNAHLNILNDNLCMRDRRRDTKTEKQKDTYRKTERQTERHKDTKTDTYKDVQTQRPILSSYMYVGVFLFVRILPSMEQSNDAFALN